MRYSLRTLLIAVCVIPLVFGSLMRLPFSSCHIVTATFAEYPPSDVELCRWLSKQPAVRNVEVSSGKGFIAVLWDTTHPLAGAKRDIDLRDQIETFGYKGPSQYEERSVFLGIGKRSRTDK